MGDEGIPTRAIAEAIAAGLGVPVHSLSADEARSHFGWLAGFVGSDSPASSAITQETLGWRPREADILTHLREGG